MSSSPRRPIDDADHTPSESTPLIRREDSYGTVEEQESPPPQSKRRAPRSSIVALLLLCVFVILIMLIGFFLPDSVQEYAMQAATVDLDSVVPEFTSNGVRARVRGTFMMDARKVHSGVVRNLGTVSTWIAREVETSESQIDVSLPDYANALVGHAIVPPIKFDVRNRHQNYFDFAVDLLPPKDVAGIRGVADEWLQGRLDHIRVLGAAKVKIQSGLIALPLQNIIQAVTIHGQNIPEIPRFNVTRLNFHEGEKSDHTKGMEADASIAIQNSFPLNLEIPPLKFDVLVANCQPYQPRLRIADATIKPVHILPKTDVFVNATGFIRELSQSLTDTCPQTGKSPLDTFLGGYVRGKTSTIYVQGSESQAEDAPEWLAGLISSFTIPVPFAGHTFENVIHNFSLTDVQFSLPDFGTDPDSPESSPKISANINAWITLPEEMNFAVDVSRIRATADIMYKKRKMGELNLRQWQDASSEQVDNPMGRHPFLVVESAIKDAPLTITDENIFSEVVQALLFGGKAVTLAINADVDVEIETALGILTVREIPASGKVPVERGF
jgi:hypothetical protein